MQFDFIVIGSGLAGLTSALTLKDFGQVLLISKKKLPDTATNLAQGGIAAVVGEGDSFESHIQDTLVAGCFHNDKKAVEYLVRNAPSAIDWLVLQGVKFEMMKGKFSPTREAAHSFPRILHASDFTGREIEKVLVEKVKKEQNITIWENCFAFELLVKNNRCYGVRVEKNQQIVDCSSRVTVLATGGLGQLYQWTTNPVVATGDGLAMAARAGAKLADLEFIQFHPTALKNGQSPLFLLSEALRGEGARLIDKDGERFMEKYDPRGELAPRDIVARAIDKEQKNPPAGGSVFLDIRHRGNAYLIKRFPNIGKELTKRGYNLACDLIPVTPAAHYSCGGIKTDLYGRTSVKNLFAFGEVAATGVHGANRLASNSLLEAVVFPMRLKEIIHDERVPPSLKFVSRSTSTQSNVRFGGQACLFANSCHPLSNNIRKKLQHLMWEKVGIVRTGKGLESALRQIDSLEKELGSVEGINKELAELKNMILAGKLITQAAIQRKKSLGAHYIV